MLKWLDSFFQLSFLLMKLSAIYLILLLAGGLVLGFAPANASLLDLYEKHKWEISAYRFGEAFQLFKQHFWMANTAFIVVGVLASILFSGLWLLVQLPTSIWKPLVLVSNGFALLFTCSLYATFLKLGSRLQFKLILGLKLAAIALFLDWKSWLRFLLGTGLCLLLWQRLPLILVFFLPVVWLLFLSESLEPMCQKLERGFL